LIAAGAATVGLWLAFRVEHLIERIGAAIVMGAAVAGMHYTGMAAMTCSTDHLSGDLTRSSDLPQLYVAFGIAVLTLIILVLVVVSSAIDRRFAAIVAREAESLRDSEERHRRYAALRRETAEREHADRFRLIVEAAPNAMLIVDAGGVITLVNAQAERLFGYTREEILGQPIEVLVPGQFRTQHPEMREGFFARPSVRPMGAGRDLYGLRKDGSEVPIEIGLNPIEAAGAAFVLASIINITERKRAEAALRELTDELERRVREEVAAREATQAQLAQAQKVQALGQLRVASPMISIISCRP
jgi:PAS domain S-box-containing protein